MECNIKKNMGLADRIIRTSAAGVLLALSSCKNVSTPLRIGLVAISGMFLGTSLVGHCPAYTLMDISTKTEEEVF